MNFLKQSSGAKIYVSTLPFTQEIQICHIQGKFPHPWWWWWVLQSMQKLSAEFMSVFVHPGSQQQVDDALSLIRKKFKDLDLTNCVPLPCLPITSWVRTLKIKSLTQFQWLSSLEHKNIMNVSQERYKKIRWLTNKISSLLKLCNSFVWGTNWNLSGKLVL